MSISGCQWGVMAWQGNTGERSTRGLIRLGKYSRALDKLQRHKNEPWAQLYLGNLYLLEKGVSQDYSKALHWYLKASLQMKDDDWAWGDAYFGNRTGYYAQNLYALKAQYLIGKMYNEGLGVKKDKIKAYLWVNYGLKLAKGKQFSKQSEELLAEELKKSLSKEEMNLFLKKEKKWTPRSSQLFRLFNPTPNKIGRAN